MDDKPYKVLLTVDQSTRFYLLADHGTRWAYAPIHEQILLPSQSRQMYRVNSYIREWFKEVWSADLVQVPPGPDYYLYFSHEKFALEWMLRYG